MNAIVIFVAGVLFTVGFLLAMVPVAMVFAAYKLIEWSERNNGDI